MSEPPPAGWYPDTAMAGTQRYWDGCAWSDHIAPLAVAQEPMPNDRVSGNTSFGVALFIAVVLPFVGVIWGIVELVRGRFAHALTLIGVGVIAWIVWAVIAAQTGLL